jgi:hypothetical protein
MGEKGKGKKGKEGTSCWLAISSPGPRSQVAGPISTLAKVLLFRQKSLILLTNPGLVINF